MTTNKTMDFFAHQEATRAATRRLVFLFALSVLAIVAAVCGAVLLIFGSQIDHPMHATVTTAAVTGAVILIGSLVRMDKLRGGGPAVAKMLGGREVRPATRDADEQRLMNVVEEMAIASGLPRTEDLRARRPEGHQRIRCRFDDARRDDRGHGRGPSLP